MMRIPTFCLLLLSLFSLRADEFDFPDFPVPEIRTPPPAQAENREIFTGWPHLPEALRTFAPPEMEGVSEWALPPSQLLVVANPLDLPDAYRQLGEAITQAELEIEPPLILLLHADGNVSVGVRVQDAEIPPLPIGVDVSPLPAMRLYLQPVVGHEARRAQPAFARAAGDIRQHAAQQGQSLQTRDLFLFPGMENTLLFGMRLDNP